MEKTKFFLLLVGLIFGITALADSIQTCFPGNYCIYLKSDNSIPDGTGISGRVHLNYITTRTDKGQDYDYYWESSQVPQMLFSLVQDGPDFSFLVRFTGLGFGLDKKTPLNCLVYQAAPFKPGMKTITFHDNGNGTVSCKLS